MCMCILEGRRGGRLVSSRSIGQGWAKKASAPKADPRLAWGLAWHGMASFDSCKMRQNGRVRVAFVARRVRSASGARGRPRGGGIIMAELCVGRRVSRSAPWRSQVGEPVGGVAPVNVASCVFLGVNHGGMSPFSMGSRIVGV